MKLIKDLIRLTLGLRIYIGLSSPVAMAFQTSGVRGLVVEGLIECLVAVVRYLIQEVFQLKSQLHKSSRP